MCFSVEADIVAGVALLPVAALSLREVKVWRELPFASLPALFAAHQLIEALVWGRQSGDVSAEVGGLATLVYLLIAMPLLPTFVPASVMLLEPRSARGRMMPFVGLGLLATAYLTYVLLTRPIGVTEHPHCLEYHTGVQHPYLWATIYIVAVVGTLLASSYRSIVAFGLINVVGIVLVAGLYFEAFTSLWCAFAAVASVTVVVHMRGRRNMSDAERFGGFGTVEASGADESSRTSGGLSSARE
jgi:MFS family permease